MTDQAIEYKAKAFELRNLGYFFLMVFGLQAVKYGYSFFTGQGLSALNISPGIILAVLGSWGPIIAAFVVTGITEGKSGIRNLWQRFWNRNMSVKWLLVVLLIIPAMELVSNLVSRMLNGIDYPFFNLPNPPWMVISVFGSAFIFTGMFEEFGWRGYVLPRFQAKWNALTSSLILGVIWASWHFGQLFFPEGSNPEPIWGFGIRIILETIIITWIFNNTKGSVLAASLFHAMVNTAPIGIGSAKVFYGVHLLVVIIILLIFGAKKLVMHKAEEET
jgi:membrane protease YdiL (CAAX protease family)